jgi:hypothetical protein
MYQLKYEDCHVNDFLVRFIGGIMLIVYVNHSDSVGWIIVSVILEGAGVIPLLLVLVGFLRLMSVTLGF